MANFEYKIHVSIDQNNVKNDVKDIISNMAKEIKNNAFQIELTGDPKQLIKQLVELKKQVPNLDLTKGIEFNLADAIKDNTEQGKKIISEFTTYIINSVNDAVTSIDSIYDSIKSTEKLLANLQSRKKELLTDNDTADAVVAFEKAQERLEKASNNFSDSKQNKGKLAAAEEMKRAYQDVLNYQTEAGQEMSDKTKQILGVFAKDIGNTFKDANGEIVSLSEYLQNVKVNSSYKKDLQIIEQQIFENQNKLNSLKKDLESAQNPELQVKGKLANNFLEDLQSQLDQMTGLEVKVKPKVDKDVKLEVEVEGDVKSVIQNTDDKEINNTNDNVSQITEASAKEAEVVKRSQEEIQSDIEKTNRIIKIQNDWLRATSIVEKDFSTSGKGEANDQLRKWTHKLTEYRRYPERFYGNGTLDEDRINVGWYRAYEEAERQGSASSVLSQNKTDISEYDYNKSLQNLINDRNRAKKILAQSEADLQEYEKELQEAVSTPPNTAGIDKVEEELHEETQAANKAAEAERNVSEAREESTKTVYRAYNRTAGITGEQGMSWFSDDAEIMKTYLAQNPDRNVVKGQIDVSKLFKLDAQGAQASAITYLGDQSDEASKKITEVYNKIQDIKKELAEKPSDALSEELKQLELEYDKLSEDESNMYGTHSTTQFAIRAKNNGYEGIEINNVIDDYNMKSGKTSTTIALFDNEALKDTEDITAQIKGNIETTQQTFDKQSAINSHADFLLSREDIEETETDIDILTNKLQELDEENRLVAESAEGLGEKLREITTATSEGDVDVQNIRDYYSSEIGDIFDKETDIGKYYDYLVQNTDFGTTEEEVSAAYEQIAQKIIDFQKEVNNIVRSKIEAIIGGGGQESVATTTEITQATDQTKNSEQELANIDAETEALEREEQQAKETAEAKKNLNLYEESSGQLSLFEQEAEAKKNDAEATNQLAEFEELEAQLKREENQLIDQQNTKFNQLIENEKKYQAVQSKNTNAENIKKSKDGYNELTNKVKEYVELSKKIAIGKGLEDDRKKVEALEYEIYQLTDALANNRDVYNQTLETKALSGLDNLDSNILQAQAKTLVSNYATLSKLRSERQSLLNKGVSEDSEYVRYLDEEINGITTLNSELEQLEYTEEQQIAINNARKASDMAVQKQTDISAASDQRAEEAAKKRNQQIEQTRASLLKQAASLKNNGLLMSQYGDQVNALFAEIQNPTTTIERLNQIRIELNQISASAIAAGKSGKSLFQILEQRAKSLIAYLSTFASFYRLVSYVRTAITTIKDLDTQLVDLRKTTTMNTTELENFYQASSDVAKQLGVTTSEIISQAAAWSRLGYSSQEAATQMAELSSKFTSISPGMTTDNATDYLVSTMQAYGIAVDDVERKIMDNVNRIGNTFATTNAEIGEMLTRSSAAMKAANNTLEETIALESAAVQITRNAETTGTAFRTISMRIRGYDEETEKLSEDLENISGDIYDLTKVNGKGINIFTDKDRTEYKSTYDILKEIANIWDELTDKQQADLLEKLGGKRGAQTIAGILADFSEVDRAMKEMENAAGSSDKEMGIIRDSIEFKINSLKQTWVGVLQDLISRKDFGNIVDGLNSISVALSKIIPKLLNLASILLEIGTIVGAGKLGSLLSGKAKNLQNFVNLLSQSGKSIKDFNTATKAVKGLTFGVSNIEAYRTALSKLTIDQQVLALSTAGLDAEQSKYILTCTEAGLANSALSESEVERALIEAGLVSSTTILTSAEQASLATKLGIKEAVLEQAIQESGLIVTKEGDVVATEKLSAAEIEEKLTSEGCVLANDKETASILAETLAKNSAKDATIKFAGANNLLRGTFSKLTSVISAHPIGALLTGITLAVTSFIKQEKKHKEEIKKIAEETIDTYESTISSLTSNKSTFNDLSEKYTKLSKGVNSLGENVGLATSEYEEYISVTNQIAEMMPNLVKGYTEQGDAILKVKGNVEDLSKAYKQAQEDAYNSVLLNSSQLMEDSSNDMYKEFFTMGGLIAATPDGLKDLKELLEQTEYTLEDFSKYAIPKSYESNDIDNFGKIVEYNAYDGLVELLQNAGIDVKDGLTDDTIADFFNNLSDSEKATFEAYLTKQEIELDEVVKNRRELFEAYLGKKLLQTDSNAIDEDVKTVLNNLSDNLTTNMLLTLSSEQDIYSLADQIVSAFKGLSDSDKAQLETYVNLTTEWNNSELTYDEYIDKINALDVFLNDLFSGNEELIKSIKIIFDIPDVEDLEQKANAAVERRRRIIEESQNANYAPKVVEKENKIKNSADKNGLDKSLGLGDYSFSKINNQVEEIKEEQGIIDVVHTIDLSSVNNAFGDHVAQMKNIYLKAEDEVADEIATKENDKLYSNWFKNLDAESQNFIDSLSESDILLTYDFETTQELDDWLAELQAEANITIDVDYAVDNTAALDSMQDAFDALDTVYDTTVTNATKASGSDIQDVISDFGGITFDFKDEDLDSANSLSNALEVYNDELVKNGATAQDAQNAANKLVTAYIDQTDVLDNLTEENYKYYIQMLKNEGITNATEVVLTRLGDLYQDTSTKLTNLSLAIAQNRSALEYGEEGGEKYTTAISNISDSVSNLLDVSGALSTVMSETEWNTFTDENLDLVMSAVEGDLDALEQLRIKAADKIVESNNIALDTTALDESAQSIIDYVNEINNSDYTIEIGAEIDSSNYKTLISSLETMRAAFGDNEQAYKDYVNTITGGSISVEYDTTELQTLDISSINNAFGDGQAKMKTVGVSTNIRYVYNGSSEGAEVGGDGSGGYTGTSDDDSDSNNYSSETFDWIETAIDRLESQIDRLDQEVENVYDNWSKRNGALTEEIDAITQEIEMQSDAADRYFEEAEEVNIMDEYKIKVQNGEMDVETIDENSITDAIRDYYDDLLSQGIGDTEDIENYESGELTDSDYVDMLKDSIDDYTDLYEKSMDAADQVVSLTNEKTGLFQDYFDNIKEEYTDFIDVIGKKVDWIEERIDRTEEHGYFVDESYYQQLLDNEKDQYTTLMAQRDELIEAMNTAVSTGGIEKGSSAWNEMYEDILDVNQAIEESLTNTVKLNNEIRQLKWDKFDYLEERLSDINDEAEFFIKLLSGEDMYDDYGMFNERGWANAAMVASKYNDTLMKAKRYEEELLEVEQELTDDPYNKDLIERKEELVQAYRDSIEAAEDEKQAMKSLVEEGINRNLQALQDLIDEYSEAMQAAKDLYDWQKSVSDQTENIANLQKQLQAYEGDDSEEARKRRQELQNQLEDAEESLEESQWDHYISETNDMLSELYDSYEETLNSRLDNIDLLMQDMIGEINDAKTQVAGGLSEVSDMYGYSSTNFQNYLSGDFGGDLVSKFEDGEFASNMDTAASSLTAIETSVSGITDKILAAQDTYYNGVIEAIEAGNDFTLQVNDDGTITKVSNSSSSSGSGSSPTSGGSGSGSVGTSVSGGTWKQNDKGWWYEYSDGSYESNGFRNIDGKDYYFDENGYMKADEFVQGKWLDHSGEASGEYQWTKDGNNWQYENNDGSKVKGNWAIIDGKWYYFDDDGNMVTGQVTIGGKSYSFGSDGAWLGYAKGSKKIPYNQIAQTQENGSELIWKTQTGALLTPLDKGDMVFTNEMSQRLWDIAKGNIPTGITMSQIPSGGMAQNVNLDNEINIVLPNVENYEDFKVALKNDAEMERFWQEITIGQAMGNNSLKKFAI